MKRGLWFIVILALVLVGCSKDNLESFSMTADPVPSQDEKVLVEEVTSEEKIEEQGDETASETTLSEEQYKLEAIAMNYVSTVGDYQSLIDTPVYYIGEVIQVIENSKTVLRVNITPSSNNEWTDTIWVNVNSIDLTANIKLNDVVEIWGTIDGLRNYKSSRGGNTSVPEVTAKYVSLASDQAINEALALATPDDTASATTLSTERPADDDTREVFIDDLYVNYETSLIRAINEQDFSIVQPLLAPNSNLYKAQKALVENLSSRGITEELISYDIINSYTDPATDTLYITVNEVVKVFKTTGESLTDFTWVYTVIKDTQGNYLFSDIVEYE